MNLDTVWTYVFFWRYDWSSQLCAHESLKKNLGLNEMWTHDLCDTSAVLSTNWVIKPTARRGWRTQVKTVQMNGYITNSQRGQLSLGLIAQSVEHCTAGYRRGHGFESCSSVNFFQAWISQLLNLCAYWLRWSVISLYHFPQFKYGFIYSLVFYVLFCFSKWCLFYVSCQTT